MKQEACQDRLLDWFEENKIIWVTVLAALAAIQLMVTIIAAYIIQKVKKISKMRYIFHFILCLDLGMDLCTTIATDHDTLFTCVSVANEEVQSC